MDQQNKWKVLERQINLIKTPEIQKFVKETLNNTPDYFFKAWASSTGKYHPACTCVDGGLVRHVRRATYIANRLCEGWGLFDLSRDIVLAAIILHDIAKVPSPSAGGKSSYADYENHPLKAKDYFAVMEISESFPVEKAFPVQTAITSAIIYHMGRWTPKTVAKPIETYTLTELAVYSADYMATTKDLVTPEDTIE